MRLRSAVIALLLFSSILSGCTSSDSGNTDRIEDLEAELEDSISENIDAQSQISTLQSALTEANEELSAIESEVASLEMSISELEGQRNALAQIRDEIAIQLDESEENVSSLQTEISSLDQQIMDLDNQIIDLGSQIAQKDVSIDNLEHTILTLQNTLSSLTYSLNYYVDECPLDNPGFLLNIGYDDGNGLGVEGDGMVTFDEIQFTVGECPGNYGMVYNETTTEHNWAHQRVVEMGGVLYFIADDGIHGWEFWRSDGTLSGSYILVDIRGEECSPSVDPDTGEATEDCVNYSSNFDRTWDNIFMPVEVVAGKNLVFFTAYNQFTTWSAADLWVSDGTSDGTNIVTDLWNYWDYGCDGCEFDYVGVSNLEVIESNGNNADRVIFSAIRADGLDGEQGYPQGEELWISDGTEVGTRMIANIEPETSSWIDDNGNSQCCADWDGSAPRNILVIGNQVWFTGDTENYGRELYRFGLSLGGGLFLVKDINPGTVGSDPLYLTRGSGGLYFTANDGSTGQELHFSLGDAFTTNVVKDIRPGFNNSSNPLWLTKLGDKLIFSANDGENGRELWITDNTELGTYMIKDINPGNNSSNPTGPMKVLNGEVYFGATDGEHGYELWKTDGTEAGTVMVKDLNVGENSSLSWGSTEHWHGEYTLTHGEHFYFSADDGESGQELWRTDGTESGTEIVVDVHQGENGSWPWWLTSVGDKLYFTAWDGDQRQLWHYWDNPGPILS